MQYPIYRVTSEKPISPHDPLHVGNFYGNMERFHRASMQKRQDLILYLAHIHQAATRSGFPYGMCRSELRLTSLREWVRDYEVAFNVFFEVVQRGYNTADDYAISTVIPKPLAWSTEKQYKFLSTKLVYEPPQYPIVTDKVTKSTVYPQTQNRVFILDKLREVGRLDLQAPVEWILEQPKIEFIFAPSGKLQLRDTSIWPVAAVENWPAWLRESLFGPGIDIDSAYTQFLLEHVQSAYKGRDWVMKNLFPDLIRSLEDKKNWRRELCEDTLGLPYTDENISIVKRVCMSIANGSRISSSIMASGSGFSITRDIIVKKAPDISINRSRIIGDRLSKIAKQYALAKKVICSLEMGMSASRENQKKVFRSYFEWEREARYKIWEKVDRHGIMVHDGIDGIPNSYISHVPEIVRSLNIKLTAD